MRMHVNLDFRERAGRGFFFVVVHMIRSTVVVLVSLALTQSFYTVESFVPAVITAKRSNVETIRWFQSSSTLRMSEMDKTGGSNAQSVIDKNETSSRSESAIKNVSSSDSTILPLSESLMNQIEDVLSKDDEPNQEMLDSDGSDDGYDDYDVLAKKEEPGDKEAVIMAVKKYQKEVWKDEPTIPLETILARTLDTVEDIVLHVGRVPYDYGWIDDNELKKTERETVVVLGSGWAAHAFLKVADTYKQRIIVVSPSNHFVFTPMLASASVGTVEYRSMTEAVRASNPMIDNYIEGSATDIDVKQKVITIQLKSILDSSSNEAQSPKPIQVKYDKLIVAVGCKVADSMVPGAKEYALRLKSCDDARRLRTAIGEAFEYASRPDVRDDDGKILSQLERQARRNERQHRLTFCIVGGGPTGVELAGELADFVQDICKPRIGAYPDLRDDVRIVVLHGGPELVPQFDENLSKSAFKALTKEGVEVRLNTFVNEVGDGYVKIVAKGDGQMEENLPCGVCVWAAGTEPVPLVTRLLEQLPEDARGIGGKIVVDKWLRCPMNDPTLFGTLLVMGDAAAFRDAKDNSYLPQTAQVAGQQGAYAARLLDRDYDLSITPPTLRTKDSIMEMWLKLRGLEQADGCKFFFGVV